MQLRTELFIINSKGYRIVVILVNSDVFHAYVSYKIVAVQRQLIGYASLLKEVPGMNTLVIDSTHCTDLNSPDGKTKIGLSASPKYMVILRGYIPRWSFKSCLIYSSHFVVLPTNEVTTDNRHSYTPQTIT
jgi:hypothetical protein